MTEDPAVRGATRRGVAIALHALGNLLLGVAVGLLAYQGLTDLNTVLDQRRLRDNAAPYLSSGAPGSLLASGGPRMDLTGWASEDRAYWRRLPEGGAFARVVIPRISLDKVVVKGVGRADLREGPGWITWTDLPGPTGNCGISGHRTTYGAPFRNVDRLRAGDTIDLYSRWRRYRYVVQRVWTVLPSKSEVVATTPVPSLTLTACHPPYSARYRIVVRARLTSVSRLRTGPAAKK
jgi:LPXTG-site transpeptidase (sortase) family protein